MIDETSNADVNADNLSDESVDKFFETGGDAEEAEVPKEEPENDADESESHDPEREDSEEKPVKKVPYGALHEERERRKELQRQVQEIQRKNQRMEETFQQMMQRMQYGQQQPQQPAFDEDPIGTLKSKTENLERFLMQQQQMQQQQQQVEQVQSQFINRYQRSAEAFMQDKPDFKDAYQHLVSTKLREYEHAGYTGDQAKHLLHEDEAAIVAKAYQDGVNPAERIYNLARMRGFAGSKANEQRLNQLERGLQAGKSLSNASGKAGKASLRLEEIASLPDDEFNKVDWEKLMRLG